ncbi:MAG TPA: hypothetical protein VGM10_29535 [Actinocrinis sp.]|jgi:hypothetical protein
MAVFGDRILRCSQGHLYTSSETARLAGSIHLGPKRLMLCPLCQKMRMTSNVRAATLTPQELEEAGRNRY